jgi:hypothetical protein
MIRDGLLGFPICQITIGILILDSKNSHCFGDPFGLKVLNHKVGNVSISKKSKFPKKLDAFRIYSISPNPQKESPNFQCPKNINE